ncbi:MAG: hypothetical protein H6898_00350 [Rhodobacter sp.]|nr:hypothetical protein [Paracoccaceae bacterium]MCC0075020.1 hypothetical protein [Rhodobacter sp.]
MDARRARALQRLHALAAIRKDAELARLASVAQSRARLQTALDALASTEAPLGSPGGAPADPSLIAARLAHARWTEAQRRRLNQQLALVKADYLALEPAAARAFGRAMVLDDLATHAQHTLRAARRSSP